MFGLVCWIMCFSSSDSSLFTRKSTTDIWERNCYTFRGHLFCFKLASSKRSLHPLYEAFLHLKQTIKFPAVTDRYLNLKEVCNEANELDYTINSNSLRHALKILVYFQRSTAQAGNMLGWYWEMVAFCLEHHIVMGRLSKHGENHEHMSDFYEHLPELIIPKHAIQKNRITCKWFNASGFQDPFPQKTALFWLHSAMMAKINSLAVISYVSHQPPSSFLPHFRRLEPKKNVIHFRCGDNLFNNDYGLYPFSVYKKLLLQIASEKKAAFWIVTDSSINFRPVGGFCWKIVGHLKELVLSVHPNAVVDIRYDDVVETYSMMHLADTLICSISTFCFYAAYGSIRSFLPIDTPLLGFPNASAPPPNMTLFASKRISVNISSLHAELARILTT